MITDIQKKWLEGFAEGIKTKRDDSHTYSVYMGRIRKRIEHQFENLLWLANNMPEILRDEEWEINELDSIKHRRVKMLFQVIKGMYPDLEPQLTHVRREVDIKPFE